MIRFEASNALNHLHERNYNYDLPNFLVGWDRWYQALNVRLYQIKYDLKKLMKVSFFIILISIISRFDLFGQSRFVPGYIVTIKNDTIEGYIFFKVDSELAHQLSFKRDLSDSDIKTYSTSDITSFGFKNGRSFERIWFKEEGGDSTSVFAKHVIEGKVSMWVWRHPKNRPDFFLKNNSNGKFVHLTDGGDKSVSKDGKEYIQTDIKFIGLMKYATDDELEFTSTKKDVKYSEENITTKVLDFNQKYDDEFPISEYKEELKFRYDLFVGTQLQQDSKSATFKVGLLRRKVEVERTVRTSSFRGITYFGWFNHAGWDDTLENGTPSYKRQLINILPFGIHWQVNHSYVRPYAYIGLGLAVIAFSDYRIVDYENIGTETSLFAYPTIYTGAGIQFKMGSNYLFTEFTPSIWGSTISIGFGF